MNEDKKYTAIKSEYLAKGLNFLGFRYQFSHDVFLEKTVYVFEETPDFLDAMHKLMALKKEYRDK